MKIIFDDILGNDLKDYLSTQKGIEDIDLHVQDFISEVNIKFNKDITPKIIVRYINLYQNNKFPSIIEFNKEININYKSLKYVIDDMCCEYCYKG